MKRLISIAISLTILLVIYWKIDLFFAPGGVRKLRRAMACGKLLMVVLRLC